MSLSSSTVGGKIKYKIVLLGDQHVGKTSIIDRFINDRFQTSYNSTIGIDFLMKNLTYQNKGYRLQLWDTAGQQRFKSLIPSYLKDSTVCILVYDASCLKSLESVQKWMELYSQHKDYSAFCVLAGNKKDMPNKQCSAEMVQRDFSKLKYLHHFQISAKTGQGVTDLFYNIIDLIRKRNFSVKVLNEVDEKDQKQFRELKEKEPDIQPDDSAKPTVNGLNQIKLANSIEFSEKAKSCC